MFTVSVAIPQLDFDKAEEAVAAFWGVVAVDRLTLQYEAIDDHTGERRHVEFTPPNDDLARIRAAVKAHDDKLNDDNQSGGPQPPTGDDYNDIHALIMDGAPADPVRDAAGDILAALRTTATQLGRLINYASNVPSDQQEAKAALANVERAIARAEGREG